MSRALDSVAALLLLAAIFGYLNHRLIGLPRTIGLLVIALCASLGVLALDALLPDLGIAAELRRAVIALEFDDTLMQGMLSFLLFAGALHVDLNALLARKWAIGLMATLGVLISAALVAGGMWLVFQTLGLPVPITYCLVFGALIAPTDPVAVLGILKAAKVPHSVEIKIAGESLFNDGVGIVVFTLALAVALGGEGRLGTVDPLGVTLLFLREAGGGVLLGLVAGYVAFLALRSIDQYDLEIIITLALVTVTYRVALELHTSGPIAMVVAGLLIGNHGVRFAMSERTRTHLENFWSLTDEILNAVLFLLIGLEVVIITVEPQLLLGAAAAVPIALVARLVSVSLPIQTLKLLRQEFTAGVIPILTWGGLRGGISVALALSLPASPEREILLTVAYGVVLFSIIVQGLTVGRVSKRFLAAAAKEAG